MKQIIITARRMARMALATNDQVMWAAAHSLIKGCYR